MTQEPTAIPLLPEYWRTTARELARRDAVLRVFIDRCHGLSLDPVAAEA